MRARELFIDLPEGSVPEVPIGAGVRSVKAQPGKVVIACHPPRETSYGFYMPDEVAAMYRPDSGVVISSGVDWLTPGQVVLKPFWSGIHFQPYASIAPTPVNAELSEPLRLHKDLLLVLVDSFPEREILLSKELVTQSGAVVLGDAFPAGTRILFERKDRSTKLMGDGNAYVQDAIDGYLVVHKSRVFATETAGEFEWEAVQIMNGDDVYMKYEHGEWVSGPKWALIEREMCDEKGEILLTELGSRPYRQIGYSRQDFSGVLENQKVILDSDPNGARHFKFDKNIGTELQLVPRKHVWAAINE